jgi:hypothetical protein
MVIGVRHRIPPLAAPRVAAADPAHGKPRAAQHRGAPRPRAHSWSRWAGSGTATGDLLGPAGRGEPTIAANAPPDRPSRSVLQAGGKCGEQALHVVPQFIGGAVDRFGPRSHEEHATRCSPVGRLLQVSDDRSKAPAQPIAMDRAAHPAGQGEGQFDVVALPGEEHRAERPPTNPDAVTSQRHEGGPAADATDQADSLARPLRRRLRSTARPARVDIRLRNPWFFARLRTLG